MYDAGARRRVFLPGAHPVQHGRSSMVQITGISALLNEDAARLVREAQELRERAGDPHLSAFHLLRAIAGHPRVIEIVTRLGRTEAEWQAKVQAAFEADARLSATDSFFLALQRADQAVIAERATHMEVEHLLLGVSHNTGGPWADQLTPTGIESVLHQQMIEQSLRSASSEPELRLRVLDSDELVEEADGLISDIEGVVKFLIDHDDTPAEVSTILEDVTLRQLATLRRLLTEPTTDAEILVANRAGAQSRVASVRGVLGTARGWVADADLVARAVDAGSRLAEVVGDVQL